jgi:hypothetical protein
MIINETKKYIIFHVPKNGGTSIRKAHINSNHIIKSYWKTPTETTPDLAHLNLYNFKTYVQPQYNILSYKIYVVVRNPIERFLSGWNELKRHEISRKYLVKLNVVTMIEFIDVIFKDKSHILKNELVWVSPQHIYCKHIDYSNIHIIPFKRLKTKCKSMLNLEIPHYNRSFKSYISNEYVDKIRMVYKDDYELLYSFF